MKYLIIAYDQSLNNIYNFVKRKANTSMQNEISHIGECIAISGNIAKIRINQISACSECRAAEFCTSAEKKTKIIDANINGKDVYVGQTVSIIGSESSKYKAVAVAYIIPLTIVTATLIIAIHIGLSEPKAALVSLISLLPYYLIIRFFKGKLKQTFEFKIN